MAEIDVEKEDEVVHDKAFDIDIVPDEDEQKEEASPPEHQPEPPPEEEPEPADWYRAVTAPPPRQQQPYYPPQQVQPPQAYQPPQREKISWDALVDNPEKLREIAREEAMAAAGVAREEALQIRRENLNFRYQQAMNSYGQQVERANERFRSTIQKDPRYSNKTFRAAANDFMYQLSGYAQAQIEHAIANGLQIPDVSKTLSDDMIDLAAYTAGRAAKIPAGVQSVQYQGVASGTPKQAPQRKGVRTYTAEETRMRERMGMTEEQWEQNAKLAEEMGL
jgi:hypothetical protein